jgi:hypothetical protein
MRSSNVVFLQFDKQAREWKICPCLFNNDVMYPYGVKSGND